MRFLMSWYGKGKNVRTNLHFWGNWSYRQMAFLGPNARFMHVWSYSQVRGVRTKSRFFLVWSYFCGFDIGPKRGIRKFGPMPCFFHEKTTRVRVAF